MESEEFDFGLLSEDQLSALDDEQKAIYQMMHPEDKEFFAEQFSLKDLPTALDKKGKIMKRNTAKREQISALKEQFGKIRAEMEASGKGSSGGELGLGDVATGAAAALGIGVVAKTVSTDGTASWQGVSPRVLARALEQAFDDGENTDIEVEGDEDNLLATIYLRPPKGAYVPAVTVTMAQVVDKVDVKVSNLTKESLLETAKHGGKQILELAQKGIRLWQRRGLGQAGAAIETAQSALDTAFDAAKVVKDLNIEDRVWETIRNVADPREKAYQIEAARERQVRQDLIDAWDDYFNCPRCGSPYRPDDVECRGCARARNNQPQKPDPRESDT